MRRVVYRVRRVRAYGQDGWGVVRGALRMAWCVRKREAVAMGRIIAREVWREFGKPSQLVVHGCDGRIQFENTYGADPRRHRG